LKIDFLEQKIEDLKSEFARSREFANEEKLEKIEAENKTLLLRLELANKKVNIINENLGNRDSEAQEKRDKEVEVAKGQVQMAQSIIDELKQEKLKLEIRASKDKETISKFQDEKGISKNDDEKDNIIQVLASDRKAFEDKFKLQGIELKKTEQKLKYTLAQLESANKKKVGGPNKTADTHAKQLEQVSARMSEAIAEVSEKRREIVKLKQENSMMTNKINELEKKLTILDKKVA
jgi:chromosome segregation ATPase